MGAARPRRVRYPFGTVESRRWTIQPAVLLLAGMTILVGACSAQTAHSTAVAAPRSSTAVAAPRSSAAPANATGIVGMHPLTCFPTNFVASVGGVSETQAAQSAPLSASQASPILASVQVPSEPQNVSLNWLDIALVPSRGSITIAPQSISPSSPRPAASVPIKTLHVAAPLVGHTYQLQIDGKGDTPTVALAAGMYDVDVVQNISLASSCESDVVGGPNSTGQVTTIIGYVQLP